ACFAIFAYELSLTVTGGDQALEAFFNDWAAVPRRISAAIAAGDWLSPAMLGVVTSIFLHGGWLHVLGNMLYLWIFGNNIEDNFGHAKFLIFYLVCGLAASFAQILV